MNDAFFHNASYMPRLSTSHQGCLFPGCRVPLQSSDPGALSARQQCNQTTGRKSRQEARITRASPQSHTHLAFARLNPAATRGNYPPQPPSPGTPDHEKGDQARLQAWLEIARGLHGPDKADFCQGEPGAFIPGDALVTS